jgi:16S rRNA processing protein RimM
MTELFDIGWIFNAHGLKGEVKIFPITDNSGIFKSQEYLIISGTRYDVEQVRVDREEVVVKLNGIDDRDSALKLKGSYASVTRENASPLEEGSYYMTDIIGCRVYEDNVLIGVISDIIRTGSNDVYHIVENGRDILIPAIRDVVKKIDIKSKRIEVKLMKGILEDDFV